jgi:hypothetical protein
LQKLVVIARRALLVFGTALTVERLFQASKSFQNWRFSMRLGDTSAAEGWRTFMTEQLIEAVLVFGLAFGVLVWFKSGPANQ